MQLTNFGIKEVDKSDINRKVLDKILRPVLHLKNFIVRLYFETLLTKKQKDIVYDKFLKLGIKTCIFDDGWDEPTSTTCVLFSKSDNLLYIFDYILDEKNNVHMYVIENEWRSFEYYIKGLSLPLTTQESSKDDKMVFQLLIVPDSYDDNSDTRRIELIGNETVYRNDVYFCAKFLGINLVLIDGGTTIIG